MQKKALLKILAALLIFSTNGIWSGFTSLTSAQIVFVRLLIGVLFLIAVFLLKRQKFTIQNHPRDAKFVLLSGVCMSACWLLFYEAIGVLGVSMCIPLHYTAPVIVLLLSPIFFHERLTWKKCLGVLVVMIGVLCINGHAAGVGKSGRGIVLAILSAVLYAAMIMTNKKVEHTDGLEKTVVQMSCAFVISVLYFIARGMPIIFPIAKEDIIFVLILGIMNGGMANFLYFSSITQLPVQTVAVLSYLDPLMAVVLSALILGESIGPLQLVGAACILGGAMFAELSGRMGKAAPAAAEAAPAEQPPKDA